MNNQYGFTMIELLLVIGLTSILFVIGGGFYLSSIPQYEASNTTDQLVGELRKAQNYSMMGKQHSGSWGVAFTSNTIVLFQGSSYATRDTSFDERYQVNPGVSVSTFPEVVFSHLTGLPSSTPAITVSATGVSHTISVNTQGVISR